MIHFALTRGHDYTLEVVRKSRQTPTTRLINYDTLFRKSRLPHSTYVFSDLDRLSYWDLELAGHLYLELKNAGLKVLNNPARAKKRYALLRCLYEAGLNDFNAYRAEAVPASIRFPVFLRKLNGHGKPLSDLLHTRGDLEKKIDAGIAAGIPIENQIVIEYAGEPVREGLFRRLTAYRIGGNIVPTVCAHDTAWLVKSGKLGIAGEKLYREELDLIRTNPHAGHLRKVFELAEIEYGRADFGFCRGRIQIFEINTNPNVKAFSPHPSPFREQSMRASWEQFTGALREIDSGAGPDVGFARDKLRPYRRWNWNNWLTRTKRVE